MFSARSPPVQGLMDFGASASETSTPMTAAAFWADSRPPTRHTLVLVLPATTAAAAAEQPANPHPPQLAPAKQPSTWAMRGSSYT